MIRRLRSGGGREESGGGGRTVPPCHYGITFSIGYSTLGGAAMQSPKN